MKDKEAAMTIKRRQFLIGSVLGSTLASNFVSKVSLAQNKPNIPESSSSSSAPDWVDLYDVDRSLANLENAYWGIMAKPVLERYIEETKRVNFQNTIYARSSFGADMKASLQSVAELAGVGADEIAFTRGATEALQILISGYNKLEPGDEVLYSDLDYDSMQYAFNWLQQRRGVSVKRFAIPEPASYELILDTYRNILENSPKAKLLLLTHLSHRTGLVMPVREIVEMARAKNVDVIVDAAHSWGQLNFNIDDLGADFVGCNLHKWIGSPVGVGFFYVRRSRLDAIDTHLADGDWPSDNIRSRIHTGTLNFATILTVPTAVDLHKKIGVVKKQAHLQKMRNRWVDALQENKFIEILTPNDPRLYGGITSFRIKGKTSKEDNNAIVKQLRDEFSVLTVRRGGVAKGDCIRVAPALYTTNREIDQFILAINNITDQYK
ncbi:aminotransferase class V-fold PLP-dependent enzyme [Bartonella sp. HY406]|uniref:aminotransferase class V-fold PLP-dependent enzyme n=1 Tax=Bartonella sp. HY406 TaxID=2979331 RepID=UPI0021C71C7D|nr:aminotransferase class V-fold PLP-dependent enzyme [Bartonella sp. HY406]UXN02688.1 aminotransferase class V-fold PLP-dependent enzyme [Bartonella sp. HY406]